MHLKQLKIQTLPGIEPGFTFDPPGVGVNIVTGPNAIGKSSLERALGYLLCGQKNDPPALSLEAEFESGDTTWRVLRNGSQIIWYRNGDAADQPALPGALQTGLYRLSVEHLLTDDDVHDKNLAQSLRNSLRGGFDLDAPRVELSLRFAQNEEKNLRNAQQTLRKAEADYDTLERQEREELPLLNRKIKAAEEAQERLKRLQLGMDLDKAANAKKSCEEELKAYPPGMDRLRGDEQKRLASLDEKSEALQEKLREQERKLHDAKAVLEGTGFEQSGPDPERLDAMELCLQQLGQKVERHSNAMDALAQAKGGLKKALEPFNVAGKPPRLDEESIKQADAIAAPLIRAQSRRDTLQQKLDQAGSPPNEAEINKLYEAGSALREWLALTAAESGSQPASSGRVTRLAFWFILAASGLAVLLAGIQQALPAMAAALFALGVAAWGLFYLRRRPGAGSTADGARQRFMRIGFTGPPDWTAVAVQNYLRAEIDKHYSALVLQRERAAQAGGIRAELEKVEVDIAKLQTRKQEAAAQLGFDPELPGVSPDIFLQHCRQLLDAQNRHAQVQGGLDAVERGIAEDIAVIRDFLAQWHRADAQPSGEAEEEQDINLLQASFQLLERRVNEAKDARAEIKRCRENIKSIKDEIEGNLDETGKVFTECELEPDAHIELDRQLGLLDEWKAKREALQKAEFEEERIRSQLEAHPEIIRNVDESKSAKLQNDFAMASEQAKEYAELVRQHTQITTRLTDTGKDHRLSQARAAVDRARATLEDKREEAWLFEATEVLLDDVEQIYQTEHVPPTLKCARDLFKAITHGAFDLQLGKDGRFTAEDLRQNARRDLKQLSSGTRMQLLLALRLAWVEAQEQGGETLPLFLDEALTTSDENRFAVMANSLEQLAVDNERQIFYLSARRHECALWRQATGNEPPVIDLAEARFPRDAHPPQDYNIATPPSFPSPDGQAPESYASVLGVPLPDPRLEPGALHLFYLLRDDLDLQYQLMDTWRINSLGQLEALLDSNAVSAAITDVGLQDRLRQRCDAVRIWTALWRRGRGRPVNRITLEQSGIVSEIFIDRVTKLAETVGEDGEALVQVLRAGQVSGFRISKIEELERWLVDEGYTDREEILPAEERRRLTLQQAVSSAGADSADVNQVVTWLESASP